MPRATPVIAIIAATLLGGCAAKEAPPVVAAPIALPTIAPRPPMPAGYAANFATPRDATGRYVTPADGIAPAEQLWHVRAGLNVAALACRQSDLAPAYNAMLARLARPLAAAHAESQRLYRERYGSEGQARHDSDMTRVYNWYAQPFAHGDFCAAAAQALTEAQTLAPDAAPQFAATQVAALAAPFIDGYRRWDDWRVADADWASRYQTPVASLKLERSAALVP